MNLVIVEKNTTSTANCLIIETTVDDVTPEVLGHLISKLIDDGADDVWVTPVIMKKSRPGHEIRVLCPEPLAENLIETLCAETGTLGIRILEIEKREFERKSETIILEGEKISIKVGPHAAKPEISEIIDLSKKTGRTVKSLTTEALEAWRKENSS